MNPQLIESVGLTKQIASRHGAARSHTNPSSKLRPNTATSDGLQPLGGGDSRGEDDPRRDADDSDFTSASVTMRDADADADADGASDRARHKRTAQSMYDIESRKKHADVPTYCTTTPPKKAPSASVVLHVIESSALAMKMSPMPTSSGTSAECEGFVKLAALNWRKERKYMSGSDPVGCTIR